MATNIPVEFTTIATRRHNSGLWIECFNAPMTCDEARKLAEAELITMVQKRRETFSELWVRANRAAKR